MDPVTFLGLFASLIEMAKATGDVLGVIRKTFPEVGRFWKYFEAKLKNDYDVPWSDIESRCYLQPEFFGLVMGLIWGEDASRQGMREYFEAFVVPPEDGRYDKDQLVHRIMTVAEEAAVEAAGTDRRAGLAQRKLLEGQLRTAAREIITATTALQQEVEAVHLHLDDESGQLRAFIARSDTQMAEMTDLLRLALEKPTVVTQESINREELDRLLQAQTDEISRRQEEALVRHLARPGSEPVRSSAAPDGVAAEPAAELDGDAPEQHHLAKLHAIEPQSEMRLRALHDSGGALGIAAAIRNGDLDDGSVELFAAAARILMEHALPAEAEAAYLKAARVAEDPRTKARQYVRAATMARIQGITERAERHQAAARDLAADHPALLLTEARQSNDSQFMLDHLADVVPETPADEVLVHQTRAQALLNLGREEEALVEYEAAVQVDPNELSVREFGAILPWWAAHRALDTGEPVDREAVREAGATFEALSKETIRQGRIDESAQVIARAAECSLLAGDIEHAQMLLAAFLEPDRLGAESGLILAEMALQAGKPELALRFIPPDLDDNRAQLFRAEALVHLPDAAERAAGVPLLEGLLDDEDEPIATRAGFALLSAAAEFPDIEWHEKAAEVVGRRKKETVAAMAAERALLLGDPVEAQRLLLPYAQRIQTARRLRDYAALAGEWEKAKDRSRELFRRAGDPRDRLAYAESLRHLGEQADAEREFTALTQDEGVAPDIRERAFGALAEMAGNNRDYERIRQVAEEWRAIMPRSGNAIWNSIFALARLSRHDEAWQLVQTVEPVADTEVRATLLAEVLHRAAPAREALQRLILLSDQFGQSIEAVEALIIGTALDAEGSEIEIDPVVAARVRDTFASFSDRFPESKVIKAIPAPKTPEEIEEFLRDLAGNRPQLANEISQAIAAGRAPVNALAAVSPGNVGKTWSRLGALPLGFAVSEIGDGEREVAANAVGSAAVWDPSSLFVVTVVDPPGQDTLSRFLPGSMIVIETLEDADSDLRGLGRPAGETFHTPTGEVGYREFDEAELDEERRRSERTMEAAKALDVQPAKGPGADPQLVKHYEDAQGHDEFRVLWGSLLLAQRSGRPLYSDDRFVREVARSLGVPTFGTLALVDALRTQELIDENLRRHVRLSLSRRGGWGVQLTGEELVSGMEAGFIFDPRSRAMLHDRARWRESPAATWEDTLTFLTAVCEKEPARFAEWVHAALAAAQTAVPEVPRWWWVEVMLLAAWWPPVEGRDDALLQALIAEASTLPEQLLEVDYDPVVQPINRLLGFFEDSSDEERAVVFYALINRLSPGDRDRARQVFVRDESGSDAESDD